MQRATSKSQRNRELAVRLCLLETSEGTTMDSHQHGCVNITHNPHNDANRHANVEEGKAQKALALDKGLWATVEC